MGHLRRTRRRRCGLPSSFSEKARRLARSLPMGIRPQVHGDIDYLLSSGIKRPPGVYGIASRIRLIPNRYPEYYERLSFVEANQALHIDFWDSPFEELHKRTVLSCCPSGRSPLCWLAVSMLAG